MSRLVLGFFVIFVVASAAPIDDVDPQKFCKNCPMLINLFLNNIPIEEKAFDKLCAKVLKADDSNPMVKVCEAGLMGEFEHIKEEFAQSGTTPAQICQKLRMCSPH